MGIQFVGVDVDILLELNDYFSTLADLRAGRPTSVDSKILSAEADEAVEQLAGRQRVAPRELVVAARDPHASHR